MRCVYRRRSSGRGVLALSAVLAASVVSPALAQPVATRFLVEPTVVRVEDASPGSHWLLVAYGRELSTPVSVRGYFQWHELEAKGGRLELDLGEKPTPPLSVWAAFEVETGRLLMARPKGEPPPHREQERPGEAELSLVDLVGSEALLVLLRRGEGGWIWTGEADLDSPSQQAPAVQRPRPAHFVPVVEGGETLTDYRRGDLFLAIDQGTLAITVTRLQ